MKGPLKSLKIVEFSGLGPGPLAGQLLADLGADVAQRASKRKRAPRGSAAEAASPRRGRGAPGAQKK